MARAHTYRARAIVLRKTKLGEQDLILTLLSESGAQLRVVGKGARKPGGRLAARCELFCDVDLLVAHGRSLDVVAECSLVEPHLDIRADIDRVSAASCLCEVAELTSFEDSGDSFLFPILSRALGAVGESPDRETLDVVVAAYVFKVLAHGGWMPVVDSCVLCGDASPTRFSAAAGGAMCESCSRDVEGAEPVSRGELDWIRALVSSTFDTLVASSPDGATASFLLSSAHVWAATHLDCRLRAMEYLLSV